MFMKSFWHTLPKPFFCLAPLADVTDAAFRRVIAKYSKQPREEGWRGGPDILWTEFVSADGLFKGGYDALIQDLLYTEAERPIIAQFFSRDPELMQKAAILARELGFDGIDINMGCPYDTICRQGAGAAMIKDPQRAQEIIAATKEGAGEIPVSVKTRIGYSQNEIETWLPVLLEARPVAITLHARTKKDMSKAPAQWEIIKRAVEIRDTFHERDKSTEKILLIGNGDVITITDGELKALESGCDGVMLGRAIFGNPWLFASRQGQSNRPDLSERLGVLKEHIIEFDKLLSAQKSFALMKKHFKAYLKGDGHTKELLLQLMETKTAADALAVIMQYEIAQGVL
jgi:nifR3 family TIM-barrel protein